MAGRIPPGRAGEGVGGPQLVEPLVDGSEAVDHRGLEGAEPRGQLAVPVDDEGAEHDGDREHRAEDGPRIPSHRLDSTRDPTCHTARRYWGVWPSASRPATTA